LDFWDLTKLLVRHWRVALPVLLATLVLTVLTLIHVKPYYVSTAYLQLVAPIPVAGQAGQSQQIPRNPWMTQSLATLGNAALVTVQDLTYAHQLKAEGYTDKYTVQLGGGNPLVVFAVTGKSRTQARDTANVIVAAYEASVANLQTSYGVAPEDMITGQRLDTGSNITISSGRVKRDVILVIALGLMTAAAACIGADMFARRRARKGAEAQARLILATTPGPSAPVGEAGPFTPVGEPAPEAPRISRAPQASTVAMSTATSPATASARVPAANRATPPGTGQSVDPAPARTAGLSARSDLPSTTSTEHARTDSGAPGPMASSPMRAAAGDPRTADQPTDRNRPAESHVAETRTVSGGDGSDVDETESAEAAAAVVDAPKTSAETVVIPKIMYANDK
jgi:hypothetical protein